MPLTWAAPFASSFAQAFSEEENQRLRRDEEKQRTRQLKVQADELERQAQIDQFLRAASLQPQLNQPPGPQPPQPGQPSVPAQPPQGAMPPQAPGAQPGGIQPPPTGQPIQPQGMPGKQGGPAPVRPYSSIGQGPAAGAVPPPQLPPQNQLAPPPPTPDQVLSQRDEQRNRPMKMFQEAYAQLQKSHPNDPRNIDAALRYVEKFKPIFDAERQEELTVLKAQHEADQVVKAMYDRVLREKLGEGKLDVERQRESRLAELIPSKRDELTARTELEKARTGKVKIEAQNGVSLPRTPGTSVPGEDLAAYNYLFYRQMPSLGMGGKNERMQILARAEQLAQTAGLDAAQAAALSGEKRADLVSLNNMVRWRDGVAKSEDAVKTAMGIVKDYQSRLNLSSSQDLNALMIEVERRLGNRDAQPFINAITTVQNEYARVLSGPTSNATLREGAVERAGRMLATGLTPDQLDETFVEMKRQMDGQVGATDKVIDDRRQSFQQIGTQGKVVDFSSLPK